jgi:hypothetical protein
VRFDRIIGRSKTPKLLVLLIAILLLVAWNAEPALALNLYAIATVDAPSLMKISLEDMRNGKLQHNIQLLTEVSPLRLYG